MCTWIIQASVEIKDYAWIRTHQVPTFELDGDQHGILNAEQASNFAIKMLKGIQPDATNVYVHTMKKDSKYDLSADNLERAIALARGM